MLLFSKVIKCWFQKVTGRDVERASEPVTVKDENDRRDVINTVDSSHYLHLTTNILGAWDVCSRGSSSLQAIGRMAVQRSRTWILRVGICRVAVQAWGMVRRATTDGIRLWRAVRAPVGTNIFQWSVVVAPEPGLGIDAGAFGVGCQHTRRHHNHFDGLVDIDAAITNNLQA